MERSTTCVIAGGGPAGVMAGLLLARAGVDVLVLEKHADFFRDFRGDTIHPSTLELMHELGLLDAFLKVPHQEVAGLGATIGGRCFRVADFSHLPTRCKFIAFMPQWDFLNFISRQAQRYPTFSLLTSAHVDGLIEEEGKVVGVTATTADGPLSVRADLVIAADGRSSGVRAAAGFAVTSHGAPMDVLWFRLPRRSGGATETLGQVGAGVMLALIDRGDYWQCGLVIPKGGFEQIKGEGLPALRRQLKDLVPDLAGEIDTLADWNQIKLLTVAVDRLPVWHRPGLLCIGDAAHAMSPVGGVGVNLAVQDAVATANLLAPSLRKRSTTDADLARVQARREWPVRVTQAVQLAIQRNVIRQVLAAKGPIKPPPLLRLLDSVPLLQRLPARLIGLGIRPEHVHSPQEVAVDGGDFSI